MSALKNQISAAVEFRPDSQEIVNTVPPIKSQNCQKLKSFPLQLALKKGLDSLANE